MKTGIFYFSSTGNGLDISNNLSQFIKSDIYFIPTTEIEILENYERIVIVTPIYSFGLPIPTKKFIEKIKKYTSKQYFCILHYGGFSGNAAYFAQKMFLSNNLPIKAVYKMKMPENFTIVANVPPFFIKSTLKKEKKRVERIAQNIILGKSKIIRKNLFSFLDKVHLKNSEAWKELAQGFEISDECIKCGHCIEVCTQKNIQMQNDKPIFSHNCIACLACYQHCPKSAINYGKKTVGKPRYQNPNVNFDKMK